MNSEIVFRHYDNVCVCAYKDKYGYQNIGVAIKNVEEQHYIKKIGRDISLDRAKNAPFLKLIENIFTISQLVNIAILINRISYKNTSFLIKDRKESFIINTLKEYENFYSWAEKKYTNQYY